MQKTDSQLLTQANQIKNETLPGGNTAQRVGQMLVDAIDSKVNKNSAGAYKEYVALLTQEYNGDNVLLTSGNLTIGATYFVAAYGEDSDFTNVGAPSNLDGAVFIATGETPANWDGANLYEAPSVPTVTIIHNGLDFTPVFWRISPGQFSFQVPSEINLDKVVVQLYQTADVLFYVKRSEPGWDFTLYADNDNVLENTPITIRIYE